MKHIYNKNNSLPIDLLEDKDMDDS